MYKKGFLDISFSWIFAIIVGVIILSGAIYGISKFSKTEAQISTVEGAKEISVLLNPLETDFEQGKSVAISMPVESKIYVSCNSNPTFGRQGIMLSEYIKNSWSAKSEEVYFKTKYLFSKEIEQGKNFYLFSKPFDTSFKVGSLIYLTSEDEVYCFVEAPREIENELKRLNQPNIKTKNCSTLDIKVCFSDSSCEINVEKDFVEKNKEKMYYLGESLMYAAIFSDKENYECNVKRLAFRIKTLSEIYLEKSTLLFQKGCNSELDPELKVLKDVSSNFQDSTDLKDFETAITILEYKSKYSNCELW